MTIIHHPDVRRMLMSMKAQVEAMRALSGLAARSLDISHAPSGSRRAPEAPGRHRSADARGQGLVHRAGHRDRLARRPGARRHGLRRGDRRRAAPARRAHRHHLRRDHRDPGQRPDRPQAGRREGHDCQGADRGDARLRPRTRRSQQPSGAGRAAAKPGGRRRARSQKRPTGCWRPTRTTPRPRQPARFPISNCGEPWPAAGRWRARR